MMKLIFKLITLSIFISSTTFLNAQTTAESRAVAMYAEINKSTPTITLHWELTANTVSAKLYRRSLGSTNWGSAIATRSASEDTFYTDTDISIGTVYEYALEKLTNTRDDLVASGNITGYGYVTAAIEKPATHQRGVLWIIVAKNIGDSLQTEVATLVHDLAADGWDASAHTLKESDGVPEVKALIESKKNTLGCDAIYLLGHVPVPYSGLYCEDPQYQYPPDGHAKTDPNSHCGAWAADVYYGVTGGNWTDKDSTTLAKRPENNNAIGDGKFDNIRIPAPVTTAVGRVDFYDLPVMNKSEIELTRQYLNKVHDFKTAKTQVIKKGIIEDNFGAYAEGFGSGAIRDFTAICGKNGIIFDDIFKTTKTGDYLLSYASGAGSYTSCSGVGVSADFNTKNVAAFNHIFGSFFGDYDIKNNFMRTSLATDKMGLTCMWSGRPKWVTHTLGLGENYGEITKRSQNNWLNYDANYYQNGTHMALLGDPSLRHDMLASPGPLTLEGSNEKTETNLSWTASSESGILGYHIYRSHKSHGGYILLNSTPTTDLTYMDVSPYEGTNHYMVRTVKETMTGSGSYINLSLGVVKEINGMKGQMANVQESITALSSKVYPTISSETITLETKSTQSMKYIVINTLGSQVASGMTNGKKTSIRISDLGSGCYYVLLNGKTLRFIKN